jgi:selenocysteine lyase/cysteine desulfurase
METGRRKFLQKTGGLLGGAILSPWAKPLSSHTLRDSLNRYADWSAETLAGDEDFWQIIRQAYTSSSTMINLNNGGVSPQPKVVQDKVHLYTQYANEAPGYYMWRVMGRERKQVRRQLAELGGCSPEEVAIMRNATDALETAICGLDLKAGDEILTTDQDYPSVLNGLAMQARRFGITVRKISLPVPIEDEAEILRLFEAGMTRKTKAVVFCHVINLTGQVLPAQKICALARERNILSIVDGAHSFCQLDFRLEEMGCDYFGTSLHKWLCAPFGTGMLYVKQDRISQTWPQYGYPEEEVDQISKFEHVGTRSFPTELGIADAIQFHQMIGTARKGARLRYLKNYWVEQVLDLPNFQLHSSLKPEFSCGIATFLLEGWTSVELGSTLLREYDLYNTAVTRDDFQGVRISPNVYTSLAELDHLVRAIQKLAVRK